MLQAAQKNRQSFPGQAPDCIRTGRNISDDFHRAGGRASNGIGSQRQDFPRCRIVDDAVGGGFKRFAASRANSSWVWGVQAARAMTMKRTIRFIDEIPF